MVSFVIKNIFVIPSIRIIIRSKKCYVKVSCKIERSKISGKHCWHSDSVVCVNRVNDKTSGQPWTISQPTSQPVNQLVSLSFQLIRKVKVIRSNDILRLTFRLFNEITNKPRNETRMKLSQAAPRRYSPLTRFLSNCFDSFQFFGQTRLILSIFFFLSKIIIH